jgi:hypothetical protein
MVYVTREPLPGTEVTERGFQVYTGFQDTHENTVRVQRSSSCAMTRDGGATWEGGPFVWLFCVGERPPDPTWNPPAPHLNREQARYVRDALTLFLEETEGE